LVADVFSGEDNEFGEEDFDRERDDNVGLQFRAALLRDQPNVV
jgi:hypothetical protein